MLGHSNPNDDDVFVKYINLTANKIPTLAHLVEHLTVVV